MRGNGVSCTALDAPVMPKLSSCSQASAHPIDTAYLESFNLNGQGKVANRNEMPTGTKTMNRTFWNKPHIRRWAIFALLPLLAATLPLLLEASYRAYLNLGTHFNKGEGLFICAIFYFIALRVRSRGFNIITAALFFYFIFSQLAHLGIYHSWLSPTEILLFFEEFSEVYRTGITMLPSLLLPLLIALLSLLPIVLLRHATMPKSDSRRLIAFFSLILIAPVIQSALAKSKSEDAPHLRYSALRSAIQTSSIFLGKTVPDQLSGQSNVDKYVKEAPSIQTGAEQSRAEQSRVIILIMGESQNIDNMSAFGYKLDTTPYLREHSNEGVLKKTDHNHLSWKLADQSIQ